MKISYNWLKTLIAIDLPLEEMCEKLTMSGLEVEHIEKIESIKGGLKNLVVGEVLSKEKHPNADKLNLTKVNIGNSEPLSIVCGASNVETGQKVVIAPIGTTIHPINGESFAIKKAKIRGELSEGMICAEDEIGISSNHDGIMVLDTNTEIGKPVADLYDIEVDHQIEIAIIPNRGDAISHLGVARELQALTGKKHKRPAAENFDARGQMRVDVTIENQEACPRYSGITLTNITISESPSWLKQRLTSIGLNPINNVVDITNYIQHEIGQPLHAFDYDKIAGKKIVVRNATEGEKLTTLDEEERSLHAHNLVICDETKPLALGGVLGGFDSGVSENTKSIFIESAYFNPSSIRKTAKGFGLNTDSSYRFERGTDPEIVIYALQRAVNLIMEIAGGEVTSEIVDVYPEQIEPVQIEIKLDELNTFIGYEVPKESAVEILQSLEIKILANNNQNLLLEVPKYRPDVERPVDIYEEIIRIYGFDNVPIPQKVNYVPSIISNKAPNKLQAKISNYLADIGFNEIMNNSLVSSKLYNEEQLNNAIYMLNPLSNDMDVMRMELLNSALESVAYNINRKNQNLKFFEFGNTYFKKDGTYTEEGFLQLTSSGNRHPEHWSTTPEKVTTEQLIHVAQNILSKLNIAHKNFGKLIVVEHASKAQLKAHGLKTDVVSIKVLWEKGLKLVKDGIKLEEIPVFPIVRRDLSLVLEKSASYKEVQKIAKQSLQHYLTDLLLFDVYEGKPLSDTQKSYSVAFFLYNPKKTMEDQEIDLLMDKLIANFEKSLNAVIRK
jgi:phenylalanyl-tRNA synthetase beta chain